LTENSGNEWYGKSARQRHFLNVAAGSENTISLPRLQADSPSLLDNASFRPAEYTGTASLDGRFEEPPITLNSDRKREIHRIAILNRLTQTVINSRSEGRSLLSRTIVTFTKDQQLSSGGSSGHFVPAIDK
jgi:hypothetical protein